MRETGKSPAYKPYVPKKHPREDDIKKAQPPMNKGIQGVGIGLENIAIRKRHEKS